MHTKMHTKDDTYYLTRFIIFKFNFKTLRIMVRLKFIVRRVCSFYAFQKPRHASTRESNIC